MKALTSGFVSAALVAALGAGCGAGPSAGVDGEPAFGQVAQAVTYSPQPVPNNTSKRVFVHVMPWFEAKATQHGYSRLNSFGQHWTMANCKAETNGLLNRICADDAPLIGPYSSSDPYVVEYHLLLMKYAGVDGISLDWPGTTALWDFPDNKFNTEAYIQRLNDFGLGFLIVNEDRNYQSGVDNGRYPNVVDGARNDLNCLKAGGSCGNMYFGHPKYERLNGVPVLATFGPITLQSGSQWASAYSGAGLNAGSTYHIGLWYENGELGAFNDGSFAWIWQDQNSFLWHQQNYLSNHPFGSIKMASVFPGYDPYYARGGWPSDGLSQSIAANGTSTLSQLLDISLASSANYIQLNTWNDCGEDTELEPTVGDGFSMLSTLQQKLGVPYSATQLQLIKRLFDERVKARKAGNSARQNELDQASAYLAALNVSAATNLIDGTAPPPTQQPHGSGNAVPGTIQVENYDDGGEGVAFHDTSAANEGGALRTAAGESVDVETTSDTGGGYDVGWTNTGEWLEYTFTTSAAASYDLKVRVASPSATSKISLSLNEGPALGAVRDVPNTGGWQTYTDLTIATGQQIAAGTQVLRVNVVAGGFNLNHITVTASGGGGALTKTLQNVANSQYAYREGTVVKYTANPAAFGNAAQWTIEDFSGFKRLRNVGNGCLVHIEHLLAYAECDTGTPDAWYSNRWNLTTVGANYVFSNAWQGTELNCFGNPAAGVQCTERGTNTDAQWLYKP